MDLLQLGQLAVGVSQRSWTLSICSISCAWAINSARSLLFSATCATLARQFAAAFAASNAPATRLPLVNLMLMPTTWLTQHYWAPAVPRTSVAVRGWESANSGSVEAKHGVCSTSAIDGSSAPVIGEVLAPEANHWRMALRSYVWPSAVMTGSCRWSDQLGGGSRIEGRKSPQRVH